ncbi:MAG: flagellar filament capping protein FliD [Calditrichaeota bacterium]|nr:flagellar filament capping protein FliD [Calditrichota bacterium]
MNIASTGSSGTLESLIQQYMSIERRPLIRLNNQISSLKSRSALFDRLKSQLSSLKDKADSLSETDASKSPFSAVQATSSDTDALTVSTGNGTTEGTYIFRIRQLATSTNMRSTAQMNTAPSTISDSQVVAGLDSLDTTKSWANAGFDVEPTGTVSFNTGSGWVEFTLSNYATVDAFITAVNDDTTAGVNIYYDDNRDKFVMESDAIGVTLKMKQSVSNGLLAQAKIADETTGLVVTDTIEHDYTTNTSGVQGDVLLYRANFDNSLASSDSGSFKINGVTISWDAGNDTLDGIISDINSSQANVTAFYDQSLDKITITANDTGSEAIQFEDVTGTFLADTLKLDGVTQSIGNDAKFTINSNDSGNEITKSSNTFTVNNLTFTLKQVTVANNDYADASTSSVTASATRDTESITSDIEAFLKTFNTVSDYLKTQTAVNPVTYSRAALAGESLFRSLRSSLMNIVMAEVSSVDSGDPATLAEIGITFDSDLHASVSDASTLSTQLSENPSGVAALFNSTSGVAKRIYDLLYTYTETDNGIIDERKDVIQDQISDLNERSDRLKERLNIKEDQYRVQLAQMQNLFIQVNQERSLLNSILGSVGQILG